MRGILHREDWAWSNAPRFGSQPSGNTTTTTNTQPWAGEQPALQSIYDQAQNLDTSAVPQYFPGNTYSPLNSQQQGLMSNLIGASSGGGSTGLQAANQNITSTLSPEYTAQTQGTFNAGTGVLNNELMSSYLDPSNSPAYATAMSNAMATALPAANASFINGNRSDSGLAQAASTAAAANAAGGLAQNQYNINQGVQQNAVNTASNNLAEQQGNQVKDTFTAPTVDQGMMSDYLTALQTAGANQTDAQNQINANIAAYNYGQMLPWSQLGLEEGAITGAGVPFGSSTTQPYFSNPAANILGIGSGLLGANALTAGAGGGFGSTALGGLLGFIGLSDRRAKTDIERIGESDSGLPLYSFRYKWEGPMSRHIGLIAQDVEKERPGAVVRLPGGLMMVDYLDALTPDKKGVRSSYRTPSGGMADLIGELAA